LPAQGRRQASSAAGVDRTGACVCHRCRDIATFNRNNNDAQRLGPHRVGDGSSNPGDCDCCNKQPPHAFFTNQDLLPVEMRGAAFFFGPKLPIEIRQLNSFT
jgi:hypothetical protein